MKATALEEVRKTGFRATARAVSQSAPLTLTDSFSLPQSAKKAERQTVVSLLLLLCQEGSLTQQALVCFLERCQASFTPQTSL